MKNILILFGGESSEHEVSEISAENVLKAIDRKKYNPVTVGITKEGKWYLYEGNTEKLSGCRWEDKCTKEAIISPSKTHKGILVIDENGKAENIRIDVCFPVLHGKNGEDGTVQGLLELSGIPYVGCRTLSSAMCMDKIITKILLEKNNIPQTPYVYIKKEDYNSDADLDALVSVLGYPVFVKPANAGSSVGASKAKNKEELKKSIELALLHDDKVLMEKNVKCREIEVAVMGNENPVIAGPGEILSDGEFYDYDTKYITNQSVGYGIPAEITNEQRERIRDYALRAYKALDCRGLSRIDFFIDKDSGEMYLNEINTLPGFTGISMYPMLFTAEGVSYNRLVEMLIETAKD